MTSMRGYGYSAWGSIRWRVINNIGDGEFLWVEQTAKISDTHKGDWDHDSKIYDENRPPQLRHSGLNKWQSWVITDLGFSNSFLFLFYHAIYKSNES